MALQSSKLAMEAIGIQNFVQPNSIATPLINGIHLRWQFDMEKGFPWYGYYIFRRNNGTYTNSMYHFLQSDQIGFSGVEVSFSMASPGVHTGNIMTTQSGIWVSDSPIELIDQFPPLLPTGSVEIDLENRKFLRFEMNGSPAREVVVDLGFKIPVEKVTVTFLFQGQVIEKVVLDDGSVNTAFPISGYAFRADAIDAVEFSGGQAALINLVWQDAFGQNDATGWQLLPKCDAPLALPVDQVAYPAQNKPADLADARALAKSRIKYGSEAQRVSESFDDLYDQLNLLLELGPAGLPMHLVGGNHFEDGALPSPDGDSLKMINQSPLDLLALSAIEPSFAQMLALYHVDETVLAGTSYDYFVVADHDESFANLIASFTAGGILNVNSLMVHILSPTNESVWDTLDGWICHNRSLDYSSDLNAIKNLKAYALPGTTIRDESNGLVANAGKVNSVGFTWDLGIGEQGALLPRKPLSFHIWRQKHGQSEPLAVGQASVFEPISDFAFLVGKSKEIPNELIFGEPEPFNPGQFPAFRLFAYDKNLSDGWYSYLISGIDLFGRHSPFNDAASWHQWTPHPRPIPHYYQVGLGKGAVHSFAVQLLDESPPPPPNRIEASALDVRDGYVVQDGAYENWRLMLEAEPWYQALSENEQIELCGLRVRWQWTSFHIRQAPDINLFRIHYMADSFIEAHGRITQVTDGGSLLELQTDIGTSYVENELVGKLIQVGPSSYPIVANHAGLPLIIQVEDEGQQVSSSERFTIRLDHSLASGWTHKLVEVDYDANFQETIRAVTDIDGISMEGAPADGDGVTILDNRVAVPTGFDLTNIRAGFDHILLFIPNGGAAEIHQVMEVDLVNRLIFTLEKTDLNATEVAWRLGLLVRQYEVFLPDENQNMQAGIPDLFPSLTSPTVFGNVGVTAVSINDIESRVAAPAKIYRVLHEKPIPPVSLPPDSDRVYASPANYQDESFYTFRWLPADNLKTHIYRALDESVFLEDYAARPKVPADTDPVITPTDLVIFPDEAIEPLWDLLKRETIANELNLLNGICRAESEVKLVLPIYRTLSNDALRVLAGMSHVNKAFVQLTIQPLDPADSANANQLGPDNPDDFVLHPEHRVWVDSLPGKARNRYFYRAAYVDGAENISSMSLSSVPVYLPDVTPPVAPKITKITSGERVVNLRWTASLEKALDRVLVYRTSSKENARDLRLMGAPTAKLPATVLRVVDGKLNLGLGLDLTGVTRAYHAAEYIVGEDPVFGGSATWYNVDFEDFENGLLPISAPEGTPIVLVFSDSFGKVQITPCMSLPRNWTDGNVVPGLKYYYRLVYQKKAEFGGGEMSIVSKDAKTVSAKAYSTQAPDAPAITELEWVMLSPATNEVQPWPVDGLLTSGNIPAVRMQILSQEFAPRFYVNRKLRSQDLWRSVASPLREIGSNTFELLDREPNPEDIHAYRVRQISYAGLASENWLPQEVVPPTLPSN